MKNKSAEDWNTGTDALLLTEAMQRRDRGPPPPRPPTWEKSCEDAGGGDFFHAHFVNVLNTEPRVKDDRWPGEGGGGSGGEALQLFTALDEVCNMLQNIYCTNPANSCEFSTFASDWNRKEAKHIL